MGQKPKGGKDGRSELIPRDEPGTEECSQRALRKGLKTPPKHRAAPIPKAKERPPSKGRVHKGRTQLKALFPHGVCDYSRPGVGQQPPDGTWQMF
jgi:hypothetical protein